MPSRKELRETLTSITHESFVSDIPLTKTSYKDAEANQIQLQALISFHGLMFVDELFAKLNASSTNLSMETFRSYIREIYTNNQTYRTHFNRNLAMSIDREMGKRTTIGRNQAIELLLSTTKGLLNA